MEEVYTGQNNTDKHSPKTPNWNSKPQPVFQPTVFGLVIPSNTVGFT
jgi:hypothetical protein